MLDIPTGAFKLEIEFSRQEMPPYYIGKYMNKFSYYQDDFILRPCYDAMILNSC